MAPTSLSDSQAASPSPNPTNDPKTQLPTTSLDQTHKAYRASLPRMPPSFDGIHPTPGRCNGHLDRFLFSLLQWTDGKIDYTKAYWSCLRSEKGREPPLPPAPPGYFEKHN